MTRYTGGEVHSRNAYLAANLQGGGGFEIWQFTSRKPQQANFNIEFNNIGILAIKIKCKDI